MSTKKLFNQALGKLELKQGQSAKLLEIVAQAGYKRLVKLNIYTEGIYEQTKEIRL